MSRVESLFTKKNEDFYYFHPLKLFENALLPAILKLCILLNGLCGAVVKA
jgi:hypothetical protein